MVHPVAEATDELPGLGPITAIVLGVLLGCGLPRGELLSLRVEWIQRREERWAVVDLVGKAGHMPTVPVRYG